MYVTELGRVASHFYITQRSIETYNERLRPHMSEPEVLDMMARSACPRTFTESLRSGDTFTLKGRRRVSLCDALM